MQVQQCPLQLWPAPGGKDESHSSSDEQTAYDHSHSNQSRQSRGGPPVSPVTGAERAIEVSPRGFSQIK